MVTLTYPANWGPYKRELFAQVPGLAGLGEVRMLTEPEAAAAHYARSDHLDPGALVAVYDLGGGTFDATVLRTAEHGFDILGRPQGIEGLGGVDFDEAVFSHVDRALDGAVSRLDPADPRATSAAIRLRRECVTAKETLSADTETTIAVLLPGLQTEVRLTRGEFEKMIRPAIDATIASLRRALHSARVDARQLHTVLLVGGSSAIATVAHLVSAELGRRPPSTPTPNTPSPSAPPRWPPERPGPPPRAYRGGSAGPPHPAARRPSRARLASAPAPRTAAAAPALAPALAPTLAAAPALAAPASNRHRRLRRAAPSEPGLLLAALARGGTAATRALSNTAPTTSHPPAPATSHPPAHPATHPSPATPATPTEQRIRHHRAAHDRAAHDRAADDHTATHDRDSADDHTADHRHRRPRPRRRLRRRHRRRRRRRHRRRLRRRRRRRRNRPRPRRLRQHRNRASSYLYLACVNGPIPAARSRIAGPRPADGRSP